MNYRISILALTVALTLCNMGRAADIDVTTVGALPDGKTLNTAAIQKAIDTAAENGGGAVNIPPGKFLTGTLVLKNNVTLHLDKNATLLGSPNINDYRIIDLFKEGTGKSSGLFLIGAVDAKNVALTGEGTIDGQGSQLQNQQLNGQRLRPFLVRWVRSDGVSVNGVHLQSAAMWCMHISQSKNVTVDGVTINNRGNGNNDGIDLDSSDTVHITNCDIDSHDDAMCLKGTGSTPCRNIDITHCKLKSDCAAVKFGTESLGDFENIQITNCQIRDTHLGGIKLLSVDGAHIQNVLISDLTMDGVNIPIFIRLGSRLKTFHEGDKPRDTGIIQNVEIKNLHVTNAKGIGILISGVPNHPAGDGINIHDLDLQLAGGGTKEDANAALPEKETAYPEITMFGKSLPACGLYARHIQGLTIKNIKIALDKSDARPFAFLDDAQNVQLENITVQGNTGKFLRVEGKSSNNITVKDLPDASLQLGAGVDAAAVKKD